MLPELAGIHSHGARDAFRKHRSSAGVQTPLSHHREGPRWQGCGDREAWAKQQPRCIHQSQGEGLAGKALHPDRPQSTSHTSRKYFLLVQRR